VTVGGVPIGCRLLERKLLPVRRQSLRSHGLERRHGLEGSRGCGVSRDRLPVLGLRLLGLPLRLLPRCWRRPRCGLLFASTGSVGEVGVRTTGVSVCLGVGVLIITITITRLVITRSTISTSIGIISNGSQ